MRSLARACYDRSFPPFCPSKRYRRHGMLAAFMLKKVSRFVRLNGGWKGSAMPSIKASPSYISSREGNTLALHRNSLFLLLLLTHTLLRLVNYRLFLATGRNRTNCPTSTARRFDATGPRLMARSQERMDLNRLRLSFDRFPLFFSFFLFLTPFCSIRSLELPVYPFRKPCFRAVAYTRVRHDVPAPFRVGGTIR